MANLNPKQTQRRNQSSLVRNLKGKPADTVLLLTKTLKANTAPRKNTANLNPKQTQRCNQSSLVGTLKGTAADTVLLLS